MDRYCEGILEEKGLDIRLTWRMVHDRSVWWGFVKGSVRGVAWGKNP